ncbi:MAG: XRE family transcriptional regulator [Tateyamaria sp.]|jgi:transcriptional regulator with XRE-family HTH domain|nr:XRE family transcriptional regulator [Tateyamaria sp.]MDG1420205.1 XRE family transcriptional regulator [Tateyamaria sp.]MDG1678175.1 XRE family transcriptional regulator [Tateyamaria sp.]MDG2378376.1 XRE family transcriptional regulator [Tateyamaria sp.]
MTFQTDLTIVDSLGADLRALRKSRGLTLQEMADAVGRSVGWVSQIERDLSAPSIADLSHIAEILDVAVSTLFQRGVPTADEDGYIVRSRKRRPIGSRAVGLVEELLSPDLTDDFEMVRSTFEPHSAISDFVVRPTQEVGYLISGLLDLEIVDRRFTINPGDSFRIRGEAFRWMNPYDAPAVAIWVIAPPVY